MPECDNLLLLQDSYVPLYWNQPAKDGIFVEKLVGYMLSQHMKGFPWHSKVPDLLCESSGVSTQDRFQSLLKVDVNTWSKKSYTGIKLELGIKTCGGRKHVNATLHRAITD